MRRAKGRGFPTCSKELARRPANRNDPNGYFERLGLRPDASGREVRQAYRRLARVFHPDGLRPDPRRFAAICAAYTVLSDEKARVEYESLPDGLVWVDDEVRALVEARGEKVPPRASQGPLRPAGGHDYYWMGAEREGDSQEAERWYRWLVPTLASWGYREQVRICLSDDRFGFDQGRRIFTVPRRTLDDWEGVRDRFLGLMGK